MKAGRLRNVRTQIALDSLLENSSNNTALGCYHIYPVLFYIYLLYGHLCIWILDRFAGVLLLLNDFMLRLYCVVQVEKRQKHIQQTHSRSIIIVCYRTALIIGVHVPTSAARKKSLKLIFYINKLH